jgi:hypothetical protein
MTNVKGKNMSEIEKYLKQITDFHKQNRKNKPLGLKYWCVEDYILQNGYFMGSYSISSKPIYPKGKMKECFRNTHLLSYTQGLQYVEGYAMGVIPVYHAWNLDSDGNIIDTTWKDGSEYYGIVLNFKLVEETVNRRGCYGVIDNYQEGWPLLKQ